MESSHVSEGVHRIDIKREAVRKVYPNEVHYLFLSRLIWNLYISGKTSIEHILRSHYRAITDINWHTSNPDIVVSTGIDSWLWAWDLRVPLKPIAGTHNFLLGVPELY